MPIHEKEFVTPDDIGDYEFTSELPLGPFGFSRSLVPGGYLFMANSPQNLRRAITAARAAVKRIYKHRKEVDAKRARQEAASQRLKELAARTVRRYR